MRWNTSANNWEFIQQSTGELTDNGDPIVRRFPINLSTQKRLGYEFTVSYRPMKAWTINSDFNLFKVTTEGDYTDPETLVTQNFDFENTSFNIRMNQKISFPNKIDLQINSNYRGPSKNVQSSREGIFSMNIAMSKDLFKERASLNLNVNDVFNSRKRKQTTFVASVFQQYSEFQWRERQISLNFVYRFNQKKKTQRQGRRGGEFNGDEFEGGQAAIP